MRIGYVWGGLAGAALIAGAAAVGLAMAPGWALTALSARSLQALGRPVTAGSVHLEFAPTLALRFDDVTMAGTAPDGNALLKAQYLRLPFGLGGLLGHRVNFDNASLTGVTFNLTIDEMGHVNWPIPGNDAGRLLLNDATLAFNDTRTGQRFELNRMAAVVEAAETGEATLNGSAVAGGALVKINAYVKSVERVSMGGSPVSLTLESPAFNVAFNGRLATAGALSLAGTVSLDGTDVRAALAWTGATIPGARGFKAFQTSGALDSSGRAFTLGNADLRLDGMAAKGVLSLDYRNAVPKLTAALKTSALRLDTYLPATSFEGPDWGSAPLELAALKGIDSDLHIEAAGVAAGALDLGAGVIDAKLAGGRLDVSVATPTLPEAKITLDGSGAVQELALRIRSVDAAGLLKGVAHANWLSGAGTLIASLQATGASVQEMVSTLTGDAQLDMTDGALDGLDVAKVLAAVSRDIQQGWPNAAAERTAFTSLAATFHIADGIANLKFFKMGGPAFAMTASGDVDFLRRAIDLRADPRLVTGSDGASVGLPVAVVVKGPWSKPKFYPDMANILSDPGAAYADLKGLGLPQLPMTSGN